MRWGPLAELRAAPARPAAGREIPPLREVPLLWEAPVPREAVLPEEDAPVRLSLRPWPEAPEVPEPSGRRMLRCSLFSMGTASFAESFWGTPAAEKAPKARLRAGENRRPRTAMLLLYHNPAPQVQ